MINPIYKPFWEWECFQNGMYENIVLRENIENAKKLLCNKNEFKKYCLCVLDEWSNSVNHHLSQKTINKQAYLGQAACCYKYKCTEREVRVAWSEVGDVERYKANEVADIVIKEYERRYIELHKRGGKQRVFKWDTR